jgi:hypothetical protein
VRPFSDTITRWEPIQGIEYEFISAEVHIDFPSVRVRLIDGRVNVDPQRDLVFHFFRSAAFTLHEEFVHPSQSTVYGREPTISQAERYTFPCLIVSASPWFEELREELELHYSGAMHYRLCTMFPVIDVISDEPPKVWWYLRPASQQDSTPPHWASDVDT